MNMQRFSGHQLTCERCRQVLRAETLVVLRMKELEHEAKCAAQARKDASAQAARDAQLSLLGDA
jgi:hypothetical protein